MSQVPLRDAELARPPNTPTLPEVIMEVENHLVADENGHPGSHFTTSMLISGSVTRA